MGKNLCLIWLAANLIFSPILSYSLFLNDESSFEPKDECIRMRDASSTRSAEAYFENSPLKLVCKICLEPTDIPVVWYKDGIRLNHTEPVLLLERATVKDSGIYICSVTGKGKMSTAVLILNEENEPIQQVRLKSKPLPMENQTFGTEIGTAKAFTKWAPWSKCSAIRTCGQVGFKWRFGYCMVEMSSDTAVNEVWTNIQPCRSPLLPKELHSHKILNSRPSEVVYTYCKVKCSGSGKIFKTFDQFGNLVDQVNNSNGLFSVLQGIPKLPHLVQRIHLFPKEGESLKLQCPGHVFDDSPVIWKFDNKILDPNAKEGLTLTPLGKLYFENIKLSDAKVYSCWQLDQLIGSITLRVMTPRISLFDMAWSIIIVIWTTIVIALALFRVYTKQL